MVFNYIEAAGNTQQGVQKATSKEDREKIFRAIKLATNKLTVRKAKHAIRIALQHSKPAIESSKKYDLDFWSVFKQRFNDIDAREALTNQNKSISLDYVLHKFSAINFSWMWDDILRISGKQARRLFQESGKRDPFTGNLPGRFDYANNIAITNTNFFGITTQLIGMSLIFGEDVMNFVPANLSNLPYMSAIQAIGQRFGGVIENSDELFKRWRELFPAKGDKPVGKTAYDYLIEHNAFGKRTPGSDEGYCRAVKMTKILYDAFGEVCGEKFYPDTKSSRRGFFGL